MDIQLGFMVELKREKALSELIGFILLLALLVLVASLYITYVVPAQGREGEIAHMDYIKGQFLDYKIGTDALWLNQEKGVPIAQAIILGTQGTKTSGMFAGFQLFSPIFSSGDLSVHHGPPSERLITTVTNPLYSRSFISKDGGSHYASSIINETIVSDSGSGISLNHTPAHLYVNFSTTSITHQDTPIKIRYPDGFPPEYGVKLKGSDYFITLKSAPRYLTKDYNWTYLFMPPDLNNEYWIRYQTDLLLTIKKEEVNILDNYPVYSAIEPSTNYTIDLMDPAYGFVQKENDFSVINVTKYPPSNVSNFMVSTRATSGYTNTSLTPSDSIIIHPISDSGSILTDRLMGRLEYRSHNVYYRTQENFVYQLGGIYVNQTDGYSPLNLPMISIKKPFDSNSLDVMVTDISLSGDTSISGSSPVQVQTTLDAIWASPLDTSQPNVASVIIKVEDTDLPDIWKLIFNAIKKNAGSEAESWISITSDQNSATMTIQGPEPNNAIRDIRLTEAFVDYRVDLDAVGKTIGI